jgi:hypothetical protein
MPTTVYDIQLRYRLDDKASKGLDGLEKRAQRTAAAGGALSGIFGGFAAMAAGGFGLNLAGKSLVGFNADVEETKIQIAGMLALTRKTNLSDELLTANKLFAALQQRANTLPGTTQEYAKFAGQVTRSIIDAGLSMKDLENLTVNSVVAARSLGEQADVAARDIDQALRGLYKSVDPFSGKVLGAIGYSGEEGRKKYNELAPAERASELKRALMLPQWDQLAKAQGATFRGVLSTVQDTLQQTMGKVGLPLFQAITKELQGWNAWAASNGQAIQQWATEVSETLRDGFYFVKDVIKFLIDNRGELLEIGKVWLALQVGRGVGGMLGGLAGIGKLGEPVKGLGGLAAGMGPVLAAGMIGWEVGKQIEEWTGIGKKLTEPIARLVGVYDDAAAKQAKAFADLEKSVSRMDNEVNNAAARAAASGLKGAAATGSAIRLQAMQRIAAKDANDAKGWLDYLDQVKASGIYKNAPDMEAKFAADVQGKVSAADMKSWDLTQRYQVGTTATDAALSTALASLTGDQARSVDIQKTTQELMSQMVQALSGNKPIGGPMFGSATGFEIGAVGPRILTAAEVLQIVREVNGITGPSTSQKKPPKVNVTIQRIEVKSDDPDRFAFGLVEALRTVAKNPTGAAAAIREG